MSHGADIEGRVAARFIPCSSSPATPEPVHCSTPIPLLRMGTDTLSR